MKTFARGLVIGKFYPPHRGHKYLIDTASAACEELTVIVCANERQTIPGALRAKWISRIHPNVHVKLIDDSCLADDDSEGWAKHSIAILGYVPDAVFTSEDYGDPYASFMGCVHVLVDKERKTVPISGTMIREHPEKYPEFLEPIVRAYFAKRVVVIGAESTGTTTLAQDLARHYHTVWVPEYGRFYSEGKLFADENAAWRTEEFVTIAKEQAALEESLAQASNGLVLCDTDAFATGVWHERYMGTRSADVELVDRNHPHTFYIVTGDEIPFVQDGTRDGEHIRHAMQKRFIERLTEEGKDFVVVTGNKDERLAQAIAAIDTYGKRVQ
jgi:NadR type nicotinamide-nucleotide adenylyltransferase